MRSLLVLALLAIGCGSADVPEPFSVEQPSRASNADDDDDTSESTQSTKTSGGYKPSPNAPADTVPAAKGITAWRGRVATSPAVDFGGGQWCNYHVVLSDIELHITVDANGHITSSDLGNTMTETATACDSGTLGVQKNTYAFRPGDAGAPTATVLQVPDPKNLPQAEVTLTIQPVDQSHLKARLLFHRTGAVDSALNWRDNVDVVLTPVSGG